jgi:ribosomal protein S21
MNERYCKICGGWHDLNEPWPSNCLPERPQRSDFPAPMLIGDTIEQGVQSQIDGKIYSSKSALRRHYKQTGHIEVGNDPQRHRRYERPKTNRKQIKESVEKAVAKLNRGDVSPHLKNKL